ncbi:MAG: dihydrofolate reductase [Bdellovibrionales bacterium]|nr:dihydrofolate reductase [Bdellovibrionales bacterium]
MPKIALVAAMSENRVIGRDNALPWRLPQDLRRFKELTIGQPVLLGRKTFESIGRLLPGREHLIISRRPGYVVSGASVHTSLENALAAVPGSNPWVYVIGGGEVYRQALPLADRIHLTLVHARIEGDAWFPEIPPGMFRETAREAHSGEPAFTFLTYDRA